MHSSKLGPQAAGRGSAGGHRFMVSLCVILYHVLVVSHVLLPAAERHTTNSSSLLSMSMPTTATTTTTSTTTTTRAPAGRQLNKQQQQQQDESMQINAKTNTTILKNTEWPSELPSRRGLFALQTRQRAQQQQQQQPLEVVAELARRVPVGAIGGAQLAAPLNHSTSQQQQQHSSAARQLTGTLPVTSSPATKVNGASRASASAVGANNNSSSSLNNYHQYRLPSWFNYYAFKRLYGKEYGSRFANELHKRIYLETALKVFEQRALYRLGRIDALASVSELSDLTGEQLDDFRRWRRRDEASSPSSQKPAMMATANNKTRSRPSTSASSRSTTSTTKMPASERHGGGGGQLPRRLPECCTYDQVYARIIEMLSSATSSNDTALSRALVDELEQRPLVEEAAAGQVNDSTTANQMVSVGSFRADAQAASPLGQSSLVGQLRGGGGAQRVVMLTNGTTTGEAEMETYNNRQGRSRSGGMVIGSEKPPGRSERLEEAANENRLWPPDQHNNDKNKNNNYNNWNMEAAKLALDSQIETIRSGALGKSAGGQVVRQLTRPGGSIGGGPSASGNGGTDSMHEGKQKTNYQSQTNKPAVATTTTNTTRTTPEEAATTITIAQQATNLDASNPNTGRGPNRGSGGDKRRMLVPAANRMIERPEDEEEEEASWEEWAETSYGGGPKTGARSPLEPVPELTDGLRRTIAGIPADNAAGLYESSRGGSTRAKRPPLSMLGPGGDLAAVAADDDERRNWLARKSATTTTASNILRLDVNRLREPNGAGGGGPTQNKSTTFARNSNGQTMTTMTKSDELEQAGLPRELEEAVRAQLAEQLSSSSPLGRELTKQLSAYFGKPVEIRAVRPVGVPTTTTTTTTTKKPATAASWSRGRGTQQQS